MKSLVLHVSSHFHRAVRITAAHEGVSMSRLVADLLRPHLRWDIIKALDSEPDMPISDAPHSISAKQDVETRLVAWLSRQHTKSATKRDIGRALHISADEAGRAIQAVAASGLGTVTIGSHNRYVLTLTSKPCEQVESIELPEQEPAPMPSIALDDDSDDPDSPFVAVID